MRTQKSIINIFIGMILQITVMLAGFFVRKM